MSEHANDQTVEHLFFRETKHLLGSRQNHAMPNRRMTGKCPTFDTPAQQEIEPLFMACSSLEPLICEATAGRIFGLKAGLLTEAVNLPVAQQAAALKLALGRKECELDAG